MVEMTMVLLIVVLRVEMMMMIVLLVGKEKLDYVMMKV